MCWLQNETEMRLEDRVAFACIFLPDARLHEYIQRTSAELTQRGKLSGILLTGTYLLTNMSRNPVTSSVEPILSHNEFYDILSFAFRPRLRSRVPWKPVNMTSLRLP